MFFKTHSEYKIIHIHANAAMYLTPLYLAKKHKIPCRIFHSHNTRTAGNSLYGYVHHFNRHFIGNLATDCFACSDAAGKWMFPVNNYHIVNNAIDADKFSFKNSVRKKFREKLNLNDKFVVGHAGRFVNQKNHTFLIDIFYEIYKKKPNAVLMLIGKGPLEEEIKRKVNKLNLDKSVLFMGVRKDINSLYQAMDVFVFPSIYEGLGIVAIESQASGLPTFVSEEVPVEAKITNLLKYCPLELNAEGWAKQILLYAGNYQRNNNYDEIKDAGYDMNDISLKLQKFYVNK